MRDNRDILDKLRWLSNDMEYMEVPGEWLLPVTEAHSIIVREREEIERLRADNQKAALEYLGQIGQLSDENTRLRAALHCISLGSQNSMTSKQDLGREARVALSHIVDLDDVLLPPKKDSWT